MRSFKDISIGGKIAAVVLLLVGMEVAISFSGIYFLYEVNQSFREVVDIDGEKRALAMLIKTDLLEIHRAQKDLILADSKILVESALSDRARSIADLQTHLARLERLLETDKQKLIGNFRQDWEAFYMVDQEIETLIRKGVRTTSLIAEDKPGPTGLRVLNADAIGLSTNQSRSAYNKAALAMDQVVKQMETTLKARLAESQGYFSFLLQLKFMMIVVGAIGGLAAGFFTTRSISTNLGSVVRVTDAIAGGRLDTEVSVDSRDETGRLADSVKRMQAVLVDAAREASERDWIKAGVARINDAVRGELDLNGLCRQVITEVATYLGAPVGVLFLSNGQKENFILKPAAGYAFACPEEKAQSCRIGEGLVGQAALTRQTIVITDIPTDHLKINFGIGESQPACIVLAPLVFEDQLIGVAEIGLLRPITDLQQDYLEQILPAVAITIETALSGERVAQALAHSQKLTLELQAQQIELKEMNEELEEQTSRLVESRDKLKKQQEVIEAINVELEEHNQFLEQQKQATETANQELERSRQALEEKARQLSNASRFKSEFLANMSHELRTPLNSILLLARMLVENKEKNLNSEEVRSAEIIHKSGNDLLNLINEVLDLAKIESGRMKISPQQVSLTDLTDSLLYQFQPMAREKGIQFAVRTESDCPEFISTDRLRLEQIMRNLISNAIKFTPQGKVCVRIGRPSKDVSLTQGQPSENTIVFSVQDSGIGIAPEQHGQVFEAFHQLDSGNARNYGGTGLGLSISRKLAQLLGGDIQLKSQPGQGAIFMLVLPQDQYWTIGEVTESQLIFNGSVTKSKRPFQDDRKYLKSGHAAILIIEDDYCFAEQLFDFCHQKQYKSLVALTGEEGLELAGTYLPNGIILDLNLPGKNGWMVLDELKSNPKTRHIPVHILSVEEASTQAFEKGAIGFLSKPVNREDLEATLNKLSNIHERSMRKLLVVEDDSKMFKNKQILVVDDDMRNVFALSILLEEKGMQVHKAENGRKALAILSEALSVDLALIDIMMPVMDGYETIKQIRYQKRWRSLPIIALTAKAMKIDRERCIAAGANDYLAKPVDMERLLSM
ncbi:MAG: response regulator, partial [Desulfobacteraceae bacterium]